MTKRITIDQLEKEWDAQNPDQFGDYTRGSHHKAIWVCAEGHRWEAPVKSRYSGYGCPYCSGRIAISGYNDLQTRFPEIAKEWHPNKNGSIKPSNVKPKSNRKYWWKCEMGHEWEAAVSKRTEGKGCPYCAGKIVLFENSLANQYPGLIKEWNYARNKVDPSKLSPHSNKRVWWKCDLGHEWTSIVNSRTRKDRPNRCPVCSGKRVLEGFNDLASVKPDIAREWDYTANTILPTMVTCFSHKKVFWICPYGHRYKTRVSNRVTGKGCPKCFNESY